MKDELPEGWIAHDGSSCPVPLDTEVQVMIASHHRPDGRYIDPVIDEAGTWTWTIAPKLTGAVIAYRMPLPTAPTPQEMKG